MKKKDELANPESCLNRATDDELVFVLLARDAAAPAAIRSWCIYRTARGLNTPDDPKIREAIQCALDMEHQRKGMNAKKA